MKRKIILIEATLFVTAILLLPPTISCAQKIAAGGVHSVFICSDSTVMAWGRNQDGQLGNGTNAPSNVPDQVSSLTGITKIAASAGGGQGEFSFALKNDSTVWAWGGNSVGQLGNGINTDSNIPVQVSSLTGITVIVAGGPHSFALKNDGTVWAWGYNLYGQLGNGTSTDSNIPVQVNGLTGITDIKAGTYHSLALKNDGTVWAWGFNYWGELGNGTNTDSNIPLQVNSLTDITAIAVGAAHSLALKDDGTIWVWGRNTNGELGIGNNTNSNIPVQVNSLTSIIAIAGGAYHSVALKNDGTVWSWGNSNYGQLGNGTFTESYVPVPTNIVGITTITAGTNHSLAIKNDGTVWGWGYNTYGQLGNGSNTESWVPVQVIELCQVKTSVNEITEPLSISIFPNPANELLVISYSLLGNKKATITINDITGQLIYKTTSASTQQVEVNTKDFVQGVYVVRIQGTDFIETKKFIVSK